MKKIRFCLVLLAIFAIMGGTAFAFSPADHVKIAPNGEGDLIFFPWYLAASGGWQTQISVINTSSTYSTVAKVVVRSHNWSDELLDFLIYLTPNDVWTGYIRQGVQGTYIYSDDDSILVTKPANAMVAADVATYFASPANPVSQAFFAVKCPAASTLDGKTDSTDYGYVEVIEVNATNTLGSGKLSKHLVYNWYETTENSTMVTENILTGYQEFQNVLVGSYSALTRAQVYADWKNLTFLRTVANTGLLDVSNNYIGELEAVMAKTKVALPYVWKGDAATLHFFTFPTKLSFKAKTSESACNTYTKAYLPGVFFKGFDKCVEYNSAGYDLKENTVGTGPFSGGTTTNRMCEEMQWINAFIPGDLFTEGWIRYYWSSADYSTNFTLLNTNTGSFIGAPVLASSLYIRSASVSQAEAAWSQNPVTVMQVPYPYYQYAE
jgi:hypothetical protein